MEHTDFVKGLRIYLVLLYDTVQLWVQYFHTFLQREIRNQQIKN